ncbi:hypothetical protein LNV23_19085 [Paucibacter sp. DJ1R-11]|uniref:hypothetical protein n=1 Tax=Paucibacter sp. DJ1R-11 TaxID=2893556 RepID=UPI0021E3839E|nr:hypothetical protein [Paucibacter sp. DJ1R-11]MCV2365559.1 hypothetical protein [Paucibacter sp. DJ1R-11]
MSVRPITDTLRLLQGGLFLDQCSDLMAELVKSVDDTGKAGKLTIVLDFKKSGGAMAITAKVTNKTPERAPDADLLWPTVEGNLSIDNPAQRKLDLRVAESKPKEIREVDQSTGEIKFAPAVAAVAG